MAPAPVRSRIHLLAATAAPTLVVIQRKRSKLFHVVTINTDTLEITHGSWFRGQIYPMRSDVSFNGKFMVYLALGSTGNTWNGICRPPLLTTIADTENMGTWFGGGYFAGMRLLRTNGWHLHSEAAKTRLPFEIEAYKSRYGGEDLGVVYERLERDGFTRRGKNWGERREVKSSKYRVECVGDDGWSCRPSPAHPDLTVQYAGYLDQGYTFSFSLTEHPQLLDGTRWATWDASGNLWGAWPGIVSRFTLEDLRTGAPSFSLDVDSFEPPPVEPKVRPSPPDGWDPLLPARRKR